MTRPAQPPPASPAGKLRFSIHFCSGEDPDYPARELLYHSAHTRGWQTPRFCRYPQELVLRLDRPSRIQQIQILSHEYKISQRLEIFVASPAPGEDPSRAAFKRLGHLSFHSNEKTNYQARELKTVHISHAAALVKFSLAGPHMNQHNIYNQVCLIAINLLGDPLPDAPGGAYDPAAAPYPNAVAALRDFAAEMNVDSVTAAQIRELEAEKGRAVAAEDYDRAKQIKVAVDRLKDVGRKVAQLEAKKRAAVEREDYDEAKRLKADIDKLRQAGPSATLAEARGPEGVMGALDRLDLQEGPAGHARAPPVNHDDVPVGPAAGSGAGFGPEGEGMGPDDIPAAPTPRAVQARPPPPEMGPDSVPAAPPPAMPGVGTKEYDERPAVGRGAYSIEDDAGMGPPGGAAAEPRGGSSQRPPGYAADLPDPEPLSQANAADAQQLIQASNEYTAQCVYSKQHRLREAGMQVLEKDLSSGKLSGQPGELFRTLARVAHLGLKDRIANVFLAATSLLRGTLSELGGKAGARDVGVVAESLPVLVEKAEDSNPRIRATAAEMLLMLAAQPEVGLAAVERPLLKKIKNMSAAKPIINRLSLIRDLYASHGASLDGSRGFSADNLAAFLAPLLASPSVEVRHSVVGLLGDLTDDAGVRVRDYLPKDVNPKVLEELEAAARGGGGPKATSGGAGRGRGRGPAPSPGRGPAPSPGRGPAPSPGRGGGGRGPPPGRGGGGRGPAPGRGPPPGRGGGAGGGQRAPEERGRAPPPAEDMPDDPATYERELRLKERQLGPDHEEVAEACSNLAILYNQNGDYARAKPLYERALRIWEKVKGPDCADVAHTLTDLAVLYLEQGDDDRGRPLLERALRIQERELGPDHPDVQAIRDVLQSED